MPTILDDKTELEKSINDLVKDFLVKHPYANLDISVDVNRTSGIGYIPISLSCQTSVSVTIK